jgi:NAD(P)-dependent dehydrogenase (short-subunit alcohol dehydrogenase family)
MTNSDKTLARLYISDQYCRTENETSEVGCSSLKLYKERKSPMKEFSGKVAIITGAASGIGRGIAERCVKEGMRVVLADIEEKALYQTTHELHEQGGDALAVVTDVAKRTDVESLAQKALRTFGGVHLLCNNAGVGAGTWIWKSTLADWEWVIGVNLWGVIHGISVFVPVMLEQNVECHIVNTASLAGLTTYTGSGIYKVTKHAVVSLSETLYLELEQIGAKVKISVLCPAGVNTRIMEAGRNRPSVSLPLPENEAGPDDNELSQRFWRRVMVNEVLQPSEVADSVFNAIREERFYILTHPQNNYGIQRRLDDILQGHNPTNLMTLVSE